MREQKWVVLFFFFTSLTMTVYCNIQFVKSGQKIWAGPSPLLDKIQKNSYFFGKPSPSLATIKGVYLTISDRITARKALVIKNLDHEIIDFFRLFNLMSKNP